MSKKSIAYRFAHSKLQLRNHIMRFVLNTPACMQYMGCLCIHHARGGDINSACNATE